ncbi:DNA-directed RNA polymerase subunit omega [Rickettsiales bacterium]|nr:DNA-directed RNA polymerase subunit omega [Rickettsiales bacterium]
MARVTTEDCVSLIPNRFELVIYACRRARDIIAGSQISVEREDDKDTVIALREIADKTINIDELKSSIIENLQKYSPVAESDIEDFDAVPLKDDASEISFDNFERENASEKKRKKIYVTESDIQKLIENNRKDIQDKTDVVSEEIKIEDKE